LNKVGYVISLIGGILAVVFSVLLIITGPVMFAGGDVNRFYSENSSDMGKIWTDIGDYNGVDAFLQGNLKDYVSGYTDALKTIDANELEDMSTRYNMDAFHDLAGLYNKFEGYIPKLETGILVCLVASVAALVGAQVARKFRTAGGAMVLSAAALTLVFSLVASSIIPMAAASLLLFLGGLLQMAKPKAEIAKNSQETAGSGGGIQQ